MKPSNLVLIAALTATGLLAAASVAWCGSGMMSVQVKVAEIRDAPSHLARSVAQVSFGEQVELLEEKDAWMKVKAPGGVQGWMHQSALSRKQVPLAAGSKAEKLPVSGDELALASKGFGADVEAELRKTRGDMDFTWVDRMEQFTISPRELATFLKQGDLRQGSGGGQ